MLPSFVTSLLGFLNLVAVESPTQTSLQFELRHLHAVSPSARVLFQDVPPLPKARSLSQDQDQHTNRTFTVQTRQTPSYRGPDYDAIWQARVHSIKFGQSQSLNWEIEDVPGPNVESRDTLLTLAKMTNNAYVEPGDPAWYDLGGDWNSTYPFGWEPDSDGFRGQVFADKTNSTVIVSIKGTSAGVFGGGGPTVKKDKLNDNLLFSCCCARVDWTWTTVCGCYRGGWKCDQDCVERALIEESLFYSVGINLYNNLTYMYPESNIWIIGHSLGGALASLIGVTFGAPAVAFESPGERMASHRLHLPSPPSVQHIHHVYHTADPIAMGTCNGVLSSCALAGYALESRFVCSLHLVVQRLMRFFSYYHVVVIWASLSYTTRYPNSSWSVDIRSHGIVAVIERVLSDPWPPSVEIGREVPEAIYEEDCVECYSWEWGSYPEKKINGQILG
ncbi:alpha/beta-hydrolase [Gymnopus androsaceus JB14]|uniref:triacylglycerol lipase n=1 Tax=Gymnopus androsaceus JB14 TaxID=1447944 RepID=A0A6A4I380_9AGAR|nr:alpha/beta-hydrolase [Gymnopus androsaceus JB14]